MSDAEFDTYAADYVGTLNQSLQFTGGDATFYADYKARDLKRIWAERHPEAHPQHIVDYGCGIGLGLIALQKQFPESTIIGLDPSEHSIQLAQRASKERITAFVLEEQWPSMCTDVDVAYSACVFHHIPPDEHPRVLQNILQHLRPGGRLFIYEHNPFNPLTQYAVNTCAFDEDAILIRSGTMRARVAQAGFESIEVEHRLFFPKALQRFAGFERFFKNLPIGGQYLITGCRSR